MPKPKKPYEKAEFIGVKYKWYEVINDPLHFHYY